MVILQKYTKTAKIQLIYIYFKPHFNNRQQLQSNISKQNQSGRQFGAVKNAIEKEMSEKIKTAQDQYQQCESSLLSAADAVACHSSSEDSSLLKHTSKKVVFSSSRSESMVLAGEVKAGRGGSVRLWMKWVRVMSLRLRQCCLPPTFTLTKHFLPILKIIIFKAKRQRLIQSARGIPLPPPCSSALKKFENLFQPI